MSKKDLPLNVLLLTTQAGKTPNKRAKKDVKKIMRENLKSRSYKSWRKRVREFSDRREKYK